MFRERCKEGKDVLDRENGKTIDEYIGEACTTVKSIVQYG